MKKLLFDRVIDALLTPRSGKAPVRRATLFVAKDYVVSACLQNRPDKRDRRHTIILKIGRPNFLEREFIRACQKASEPFPVKKIQLKFYR
jgi:hypothetical protein